jgi:hypothetical protein
MYLIDFAGHTKELSQEQKQVKRWHAVSKMKVLLPLNSSLSIVQLWQLLALETATMKHRMITCFNI